MEMSHRPMSWKWWLQPARQIFRHSRLGLFFSDASARSLPIVPRIRAARHGFRAYTAKLYKLDRHNVAYYVSDLQRRATRHITPKYNIIFDDKLVAKAIFSRVVRTPDTLAYLDRGRAVDDVGNVLDIQSVIERVRADGRAVLKPIKSSGGKGVKVLSVRDGRFFADEQSLDDPHAYLNRCERSFLSTFVVQHPYAACLYPRSVNTLRIVTMRDPDTREVFVSHALQRIGTNKSAPADNFSRGGLVAAIDAATGRLLRVAKCDKATGMLDFIESHPDTGATIVGQQVPNWEEVLRVSTRAHSSFIQAELVAWDFALDQSAEPVMIEANASTDVDLIQIHGPMLTDERVRRFFEHHGIICERRNTEPYR
jgi:hypothetical protein